MGKRESVVFQATNVLKQAYSQGHGRSRHADKKNAINNGKRQDTYTKDKIYSDKTYNSTKKTCVSFVKHCRAEFGVRYLNEIKPEMFKSFISKGDFNTGKLYDPKTAKVYATQISKLQNAYNKQNREDIKFIDTSYKEVVGQQEQKRIQMPREVHHLIVAKAYSSKIENGLAFDIARAMGLRVREITNLRKEDFKFNNKVELQSVHIHRSKGGRNRDIQASNLSVEQREVVETVYNHFKDKTSSHDRFFINKADSYSTAFSRARDSVTKCDEYTHCGIHSMRKEFAKDFYSRETEAGRRDLEIRRELTEMLGHNRLEVLETYLK